MQPSNSEAMRRRVRRLARAAEWLAILGIAIVAVYEIYLLIDPAELLRYLRRGVPEAANGVPAPGMLTWAWVADLVPVGLFLIAMVLVVKLFRRLRSATFFHPDVPRLLTRIGHLTVASAVAAIVSRTLVGLALTSGNPPGQRQFIVSFSSGDITSLITGLLLLAFALVMQEALRIDEENRSFL